MESTDRERSEIEVQVMRSRDLIRKAMDEIANVVVGQTSMIEGMFMGVLAGGHVLLEGVPGLAKTLAIKSMAEVIDASFKRIQFTPDLLPADLVGTMIYRQQTGEFVPRKGPVFSNIILADEINRAPAKVQSAMLEAMEENQVTIGDNTYPLPEPFFVLATQNPIEQEGTYPLPEAQLDRFILKLTVNYPSAEEELQILRRMGTPEHVRLNRQVLKSDIKRLRETAAKVTVDERIEAYIVDIVAASRQNDRGLNSFSRFIEFGASPRASIYLYRTAKVKALMEGRSFVVPEDVKYVAPMVLRHRINLSYEAESEDMTSEDVISYLLSAVPVP
jgi:MoxR-like ATPase